MAVGLSSPASAEPLVGQYTLTVISSNLIRPGSAQNLTMSPCGPDCTAVMSERGWSIETRLQGNTWTGSDPEQVLTIDKDSLAGTQVLGNVQVQFQLTKIG